jgi:hypothetical protein
LFLRKGYDFGKMLFNQAELFLNGRDFWPGRPKNLERVGSAENRQYRGLSVAKVGKTDYCKNFLQ